MYQFNSKEELFDFIRSNLISSSEAGELLGKNRQKFNRLVQEGLVKPIKENPSLFFLPDIEAVQTLVKARQEKYTPNNIK